LILLRLHAVIFTFYAGLYAVAPMPPHANRHELGFPDAGASPFSPGTERLCETEREAVRGSIHETLGVDLTFAIGYFRASGGWEDRSVTPEQHSEGLRSWLISLGMLRSVGRHSKAHHLEKPGLE
jgi:hypothetical protein